MFIVRMGTQTIADGQVCGHSCFRAFYILFTTTLSDCLLAYTSLVPKPSWNDGGAKSTYFLNSSNKIIQSAAIQHYRHAQSASLSHSLSYNSNRR